MCVLFETPSCLLLLVMPVDVLATRVQIQAPMRFLLLVLSSLGCHWIYCVLRPCPATVSNSHGVIPDAPIPREIANKVGKATPSIALNPHPLR